MSLLPLPEEPIFSTTITDSPYQFVSDGHHRVFASIMAGKTLIPYHATKHTDKATVSREHLSKIIYSHEEGIKKPDGTEFRYAKYPEIDENSELQDRI